MTRNANIWLNAVMGVVTGDALGCPVQFESREEVARHPIKGMRGYGTFDLPEGSWTDDSSLTIALLESIRRCGEIRLDDIMENFMKWLFKGEFTPYGYSYDIGNGTYNAINRYRRNRKVRRCGGDEEWNNGNGSLMRIMPACVYCSEKLHSKEMSEREAVTAIHSVGSLTHAHIRSNIACGLYFFMADQILWGEGTLRERMQTGLGRGFAFYEGFLADKDNLHYYRRLRDLDSFAETAAARIKSSGYVVDTLEAAVWCLIRTDRFEQALLTAVNLGEDTDTVGAVTGGLAGLFYGYDRIPSDWLATLKRRDWIEEMCRTMGNVSMAP